MAELTEKCKTCKKAFHIWRWGIYGSCPNEVCEYEEDNTPLRIETAEDVTEIGMPTYQEELQ